MILQYICISMFCVRSVYYSTEDSTMGYSKWGRRRDGLMFADKQLFHHQIQQ